jgi:hypothetical protein
MSAPTILCRGSGERAGDGLGHLFDNSEQHARTAFWPALALLPIPNGAKPQTEAHGKGLSDLDFLCFVEYWVRVLNVLPLARAEAADAVVRWIVAVPTPAAFDKSSCRQPNTGTGTHGHGGSRSRPRSLGATGNRTPAKLQRSALGP